MSNYGKLTDTFKPVKNGKVVNQPKYVSKLNMTVNELNNLSQSELYDVVHELGRITNIKLTKIGIAGYGGMWSNMFPKGKFTVSKDVRVLRKQYSELNRFLQSKTSSVKGLKDYQRKTQKLLGIKTKPTARQFSLLGRVMSRMHELGKFTQWYDSHQAMKDIGQALDLNFENVDDIIEFLDGKENENYLAFVKELDDGDEFF